MVWMNDFNLITFVGMPGAGKSSCVDYLKEKKGWPFVYFGGITLEEIKRRGLEVNEKNEKFVREDIRAKEGKDAYAKRIVEQVEKMVDKGVKTIIVDGLYSWTEYKVFKERFGDKALIIAVAAPRKVRHARLANRPDRPLSEEDVSKREYAEIENIEKGGPIANADYTIANNGSTEEMLKKVDELLTELNVS